MQNDRDRSEIYQHLKSVIKKRYGLDATNVGAEGGFAPSIQDNKEGELRAAGPHADKIQL